MFGFCLYDVSMIRYNLYITNDQYRFLKKLSKNKSSVSEYIRIALNEYLEKIKKEKINVSESLSINKGEK